jgi:hypothetical protein
MNHTPEIEEAGCARFESTLGLMDGILSGSAKAEAEQHAVSCPLCGPMLREWAPMSAALVHHFEDKAELAKPALAQMPDRVFAAIDRPKRVQAPSFFARLAAKLHLSPGQFGFVAAAAAVAVVLVPFAKTGPGTIAPSPSPSPVANAETSGGEFQVHELAFDGAEGTVYTAGDDMPVIWVSESDDA